MGSSSSTVAVAVAVVALVVSGIEKVLLDTPPQDSTCTRDATSSSSSYLAQIFGGALF